MAFFACTHYAALPPKKSSTCAATTSLGPAYRLIGTLRARTDPGYG